MRRTGLNAISHAWARAAKGFCYVIWCNTTDQPFFCIPTPEEQDEDRPALIVYVFSTMEEAREYKDILTRNPMCRVDVEIRCMGLSDCFKSFAHAIVYIESKLDTFRTLRAEFAYLRDGRTACSLDSLWNCADERH